MTYSAQNENIKVKMSDIREGHKKIEDLQSIVDNIKELNKSKELTDKKGLLRIEKEISEERKVFDQKVSQVKEIISKIQSNENLNAERTEISGSTTILMDQKHTLTVNLSLVLSEYGKMELAQKNHEKKELKEHLKMINPKLKDSEIEDEIERKIENNDLNFRDSESARRLRKISEMVHSIEEINYLIKEISQMVETQSDFVDQIEIDVSASKVTSSRANEDFRQIRARKRRWKFIKRVLIFIAFLAIVILIAYLVNSFSIFFKK